jgi:poly(3-hydroxybutyrate) depolymerase
MLFPTILISALLALSADAVNHRVKHRSSGCGKELKGTERQTRDPYQYIDSQSGATPRKYLINFPEGYKNDVAVPLIFSYHGRTKSAIDQRLLSRFSNSTYGFDGIVVYPEGVKVCSTILQRHSLQANIPL